MGIAHKSAISDIH